jgi:hypothetical protein
MIMRTRTCGAVRRQLSAYHDGELAVHEQIAVEAHLRECAGCAVEAQQLRSLSAVIRVGAVAATAPAPELDAFATNLVSRLKAERAGSFGGMTRALFDDLHLVWAALGATGATVACLAIVFTLFYFATRESPESMAAMIATMSSPSGSNQNPVAQLNASLRLPTLDAAFPEAVTHDQDAVFALAAVVTREGTVEKLNLLPGSEGTGPDQSAKERRELEALLTGMSKARFQPARYGENSVAVNMVWLHAQVNVRGKVPTGSKIERRPIEVISSLPQLRARAA